LKVTLQFVCQLEQIQCKQRNKDTNTQTHKHTQRKQQQM
jgi:hypothetical protein